SMKGTALTTSSPTEAEMTSRKYLNRTQLFTITPETSTIKRTFETNCQRNHVLPAKCANSGIPVLCKVVNVNQSHRIKIRNTSLEKKYYKVGKKITKTASVTHP